MTQILQLIFTMKSFFSCFYKNNDMLFEIEKKKKNYFKYQLKNEKKKKLKHLFDIGNFKPQPVYFDNGDTMDVITGLCSLCENPIHISIGANPARLILSHCYKAGTDNDYYKRDNCFYIMNLYENITDISQITQYDIYVAIQKYIKEFKKHPKYVECDSYNIQVAI